MCCVVAGIRQDQLETVIPHDLTSAVMIVRGSSRSQVRWSILETVLTRQIGAVYAHWSKVTWYVIDLFFFFVLLYIDYW